MPTTGSAPCPDAVVVVKLAAVVVCCTDGDGCAGGGVVVAHGFRIAVVGFSKLDRCLLRCLQTLSLSDHCFIWKLSLNLN